MGDTSKPSNTGLVWHWSWSSYEVEDTEDCEEEQGVFSADHTDESSDALPTEAFVCPLGRTVVVEP